MDISTTLWKIMCYAKQDRMAFIDAYNDNKSEKCVREAYKEIEDIKALQTKIFGGSTTQQEAMLKKMTLADVRKLLNSEPNAELTGRGPGD